MKIFLKSFYWNYSLFIQGVLIFTATVYSWRLQLLSTSLSILRSISGCSLLASSATVISIAMLSPLVYMANESPALQVWKKFLKSRKTTDFSASLPFTRNPACNRQHFDSALYSENPDGACAPRAASTSAPSFNGRSGGESALSGSARRPQKGHSSQRVKKTFRECF